MCPKSLPPIKKLALDPFGRAMPADSVAQFTARFDSDGREVLRFLLLALLAEFTLLPLRDARSGERARFRSFDNIQPRKRKF